MKKMIFIYVILVSLLISAVAPQIKTAAKYVIETLNKPVSDMTVIEWMILK